MYITLYVFVDVQRRFSVK